MIKFSLKLKFDKDLEKEFVNDFNKRSLPITRLAYILVTLLIASFGILDIWIAPYSRQTIWIIRYIIVMPILIISLALTYAKIVKDNLQILIFIDTILVGLGLIAMIAVSKEYEAGFTVYYVGIILAILAASTLFRLRFFYSIIASLILLTAYELMAVFIQKKVDGGFLNPNMPIFLNNNFFLISAIIIGTFASYFLEYYIRKVFLQNRVIEQDRSQIRTLLREIQQELKLAWKIQCSTLPEKKPDFGSVQFYAHYKPMTAIGGDFYDFINFKEDNLIGIFQSDVSGHGVPAALITSMVKTLINTSGINKLSPSGLLSYINSKTLNQIGDNFITAVYGIYDANTNILTLGRAGHTYPVLIKKKEVQVLKSKGQLLGYLSDFEIEEIKVDLCKGDKVLLFTDGLTESINEDRVEFYDYMFSSILPEIAELCREDFVQVIFDRLVQFKGNDNFEDDICIIGLEIV